MSSFKANYRGIGEMLSSPQMQAAMHSKAEKIATAAEAMAPVGPVNDPHRGDYKAGFEVSSGVRSTPSRRAYGRVENNVPHAASVEFGNAKGSPAQHVLGRALDAAKD
jgi:hypothetical protein